MADTAPGTAPVADHRTPPRGVLPRGTQTWLMAGLAVGILAIIVFTGHPQPAARTATASTAQALALAPNPERLRDYSDRLRALDERARQQAVDDPPRRSTPPAAYGEPPTAPPPDPLEADRKRREYESLFSSNVVVSRRPEAQRLATGLATPTRGGRATALGDDAPPVPPSLDDVAEAVMRASARTTQFGGAVPSTAPFASPSSATGSPSTAATRGRTRAVATGPITGDGPLHRLLEGTVIDTVLTNRLDGSVAAPVNCLVTNAIYSHDGQQVLIPAGSRVLGETKPVQAFGESRLAVAFNRLVLPDGRTYPLEQFMGLNEIGDAGLRDQVDQHYKSTFGAAAAVGLISGFSQFLGAAGFGQAGGASTIIIAGGAGASTAQATGQTMNRFLNRMPTITIREGHRIKVYLTNDLELPAYHTPETSDRSLLAQSTGRIP